MDSTSLFDEACATTVSYRVYHILKDIWLQSIFNMEKYPIRMMFTLLEWFYWNEKVSRRRDFSLMGVVAFFALIGLFVQENHACKYRFGVLVVIMRCLWKKNHACNASKVQKWRILGYSSWKKMIEMVLLLFMGERNERVKREVEV